MKKIIFLKLIILTNILVGEKASLPMSAGLSIVFPNSFFISRLEPSNHSISCNYYHLMTLRFRHKILKYMEFIFACMHFSCEIGSATRILSCMGSCSCALVQELAWPLKQPPLPDLVSLFGEVKEKRINKFRQRSTAFSYSLRSSKCCQDNREGPGAWPNS